MFISWQMTMCSFLVATLFVILSSCTCSGQTETKSTIRDEVSYTNDIRPIVNNFCTTCHAGDAPEGEFVLTSYKDVRKHVEKGELLPRINDAKRPMPQNGFDGLKPGDQWCLCAARFLQAYQAGKAPRVSLQSTHRRALEIVPMEALREMSVALN